MSLLFLLHTVTVYCSVTEARWPSYVTSAQGLRWMFSLYAAVWNFKRNFAGSAASRRGFTVFECFYYSWIRLATANRSRISICDRPVKIFFTPSLITTQQLVVCFSYCVRACRRSKKLGRMGPLETRSSPRVTIRTSLVVYRSNRVGRRGIPQIRGRCGPAPPLRMWAWLDPWKHVRYSPLMLSHQIWSL